ncbi:class I SAM-dependent methyltransferase [Motilibacter deserti]|uniref:Methyltransferase domain-containing protein n=1 Tax=Motilibacter deserti TaxID=2714956 RepID=A0ABX0GVJ3_9ACTN|nr:class I SAM-dependent methyltransferase [Motilibacter deserti]NHC14953.1 methyltransferase domain-containing protein [Motilibacter deserti]
MWALGNYPAVVDEVIAPLGPILVEASGVRAGERVLDVAAGSGNVALPAAAAGADVLATDLTPELLEVGRKQADRAGVRLEWQEADAEALPLADASFDAVLSCVGVMFAPHHQRTADELVRVCRPGGRIGLINWTPEGFIGQLFATMKPYAPPPPPGASPPPLWGSEDHVRTLLGDAVVDVQARRQALPVCRFSSGEELRDFFKAVYGPTIAVFRSLEGDAERTAALDAAIADLARRFTVGAGGSFEMEWEYLLLTALRR